ncbi:MAG: HYR domain-containing protein, partial [Saprospiraceae bacterium]|nr:HYR domain-containing protein [Saprospiraceae bacterium]
MTITIEDNEEPGITCPSSGVRPAEPGLCTYTITGTEFDPVSVTDNCMDFTFTNTLTDSVSLAGVALGVGVHNITWVVNDQHGQSAMCDITITVEDTQVPSITCPPNATLAITAAECDTQYVYSAITSDNCAGEVVDVLSGVGSGGSFSVGVHTEVLQVTDVGGNTATCSFNVSVISLPDVVYDTICFGDSTFLGGAFQYLPGAYVDTFMNILGCDSVVITSLDTTTACYWPTEIVYVDSAATGANTGVDWPNAYVDLQLALDVASRYLNITQIWVAEGTYYPTAGPDRAISFVMVDSVAIYGGFQGFETDTSGRDPTLYPSRLSGNIGASGVATDNTYRVLVCPPTVSGITLDGFIVQDGYANGPLPEQKRGAGLYTRGDMTLANTVIT